MKKNCLLLLVIAALLCWSAIASAGTLSVKDSNHWIPSGDVDALKSEFNGNRFDIHILVESAANLSVLENDAHRAVTSPNVLAIAIDPNAKKTVVRVGSQTGIKVGDFDTIASAGNVHFRSREIRQGLEAIIFRATASSQSTTAIVNSTTPVVVQRTEGLSAGAWIAIVLGFACLIGFIVWLVRRQKEKDDLINENRLIMSELHLDAASRLEQDEEANFDRRISKVQAAPVRRTVIQRSQPQVVVQQQPQQVIVQQQPQVVMQPPVMYSPTFMAYDAFGNPMIGGRYNYRGQMMYDPTGALIEGMILGAELDALSGSRYNSREIIHEREIVHDNYDNGGSASSWDNSGSSSSWGDSSSSSNDSGGSSSDWSSGSNDSNSGSSSWDSGSSGSDFGSSGGGDSSW
jgi:uncharacterized membrane protein YgcG